MSPLFRPIRCIFLCFLTATSIAFADSPTAPSELESLIIQIDQDFRSSSRFVEGLVLYEQAFHAIPSARLRKLREFTRPQLLTALHSLQDTLKINKGVAENLIKIHTMVKLQDAGLAVTPNSRQQHARGLTADSVTNLTQTALDEFVKDFPGYTESLERKNPEFNLMEYRLTRKVMREMTDNDWYNFKMAASYFKDGLHKSHIATYRMFARGHENRPWMIAAGVELALKVLQNLHFTESDIQYFKNHPQFSNAVPEFFEYLRTWKFSGQVRAIPDGTLFAPNEAVMEIESDPISAHIVETILTPIVETASKSATQAARTIIASHGRMITEGGSRRSGSGFLGAYGALIGGVAGSSNVLVSILNDKMPYGSMAHAFVGMMGHELKSFVRYLEDYPESTLLIDTTDQNQGMRNAIIAGGSLAAGLRTDSDMPNKTFAETAQHISAFLNQMGYSELKLGESNQLTPKTLSENPPSVAPFHWALVGTDIQNPSDASGLKMVYKLVHWRNKITGQEHDEAKFAEGKKGIAGQTETFREYKVIETELGSHEEFAKDWIGLRGEIPPVNSRPLLVPAMQNRKMILPKETVDQKATRARLEIAKLPEALKVLEAKRGDYPVEWTGALVNKMRLLAQSKRPHSEYKVGVMFGSFDPIHEGHKKIIERSKLLYNLDTVIVVPTGNNPVHGKKHKFNAEVRFKMVQDEVKDIPGVIVYDGESKGETRFAYDTLTAMKQKGVIPPRSHVHIIEGQDAFETVPTWKNADQLLLEHSWIVAARGSKSLALNINRDLLPNYEAISARHFENAQTGHFLHLVDLRTGNLSSSQIRERMSQVDTIFHAVDVQWTFWESIHGREPGTLAVSGSAEITANVIKLTEAAKNSGRSKSIATKDFHWEIEREQAETNGEFHEDKARGIPGFPAHGMAQRSGGAGHELIPEVKEVFAPENRLTIPHNREVKGRAGEKDQLILEPFDLDPHMDEILDPEVQIVIQKNGPQSYDFGMNPRSEAIVKAINPKRVIIYGVATDFCVRAAVETYLKKWGYEVWVVTDAIRGVFPESTANALKEMKEWGVRFVTTEEVLQEYKSCESALTGAAG